MSLLMQALRKAERARVQNGQEAEHTEPQFGQDAVPSPPPMEGGPAFAVMPDAWRLEPLDAEPPVIPAQEAAHDPVPPQARHEARRAAPAAGDMPPAPARGKPAREWQDSDGPAAGAGPFAADSAVRAGPHAPLPPRAIASSQRRLGLLLAALFGLLLVFGVIYWRAMSGPGPGARLPMVPMPAPGAATLAPGAAPGAAIPVAPYVTPAAPGGMDPAVAASAAAGAGALQPPVADAGAPAAAAGRAPETGTGAGVAGGQAGAPAAPPTRPSVDVTVPTPEQLAAITDPAIRAEAMRDAAERAARQARSDYSDAPAGSAGLPPAAAAPAPAIAATATGASGRQRAAGTAAKAAGDAGNRTRSPAARARPAADDGAPRQAHRSGAAENATTLQTAVGESGDVRFVRGAAPTGIAPAVQNGYNALRSGDLLGARQQYDLALLQDPNNRDALLGAAAVALREGDGRQASNNYLRLLELDPNDPEALAALAELRSGDLEANEVRLKGVARKHPESGPVQFALGNLLARQGRWPEAQQSYFRAYSAMPDNADYAYNLGVGLDRMNQPRLAQTYYRRALELAQAGPPAFNVEAVRKRIQALETPPR